MTVCKYFLQGTCNFGDRCKFEHPRGFAGGGGGGGGGGFTRTINNDAFAGGGGNNGAQAPRRFGSQGGGDFYNNNNDGSNYRPTLAHRLGGGSGGGGYVQPQHHQQSRQQQYSDDMSVDGNRLGGGGGSSIYDRLGPRRSGGAGDASSYHPQQNYNRPRQPRYDNYNDNNYDNNNYNNSRNFRPRFDGPRVPPNDRHNSYRPRYPSGGGHQYDNRQQQQFPPEQANQTPRHMPFDGFGDAATTPAELCSIVGDDISDWHSSTTMWPLSSYAFAWSDAATSSRQNVPIFGFNDVSPEEVRLAYRQAYTSVTGECVPYKPLGAVDLQQEALRFPQEVQQQLINTMKEYETTVSGEVHKSNAIKDEILRRLKTNAVDPDIVREVKQERSLIANPFRQLALSLSAVQHQQQPLLSLLRPHASNYSMNKLQQPSMQFNSSSNNFMPSSNFIGSESSLSAFGLPSSSSFEQFPAPVRVQSKTTATESSSKTFEHVQPQNTVAVSVPWVFGSSAVHSASSILPISTSVLCQQQQNDAALLYSKYLLPTYTASAEELTERDKLAYAADKFDFDCLPSRPPTAEMCQ